MYSIIGATVWIAGLTAWNCVFQMNRASWGATGDVLSGRLL
jgi:presenilin enhancer 2